MNLEELLGRARHHQKGRMKKMLWQLCTEMASCGQVCRPVLCHTLMQTCGVSRFSASLLYGSVGLSRHVT